MDERETHISHSGSTIESTLLLHLKDDVLHHLTLVLRQLQGFGNRLVALHKFSGSKAQGQPGTLGVVLDKVHDAMETTMYGASVVVLAAEVLPRRYFLIIRHVDGMLHEFVDTLILSCRNSHDWDAEDTLHIVQTDGAAVARHLVHHIKRQHHRNAQLHELYRQIEMTLDVRSIHNIDKAMRLFLEDEIAADNLLCRISGEAVDAWEVDDVGRSPIVALTGEEGILDLSVLTVDGNAREISHVLVGARELVEERGLAAVLLPGKGEGERGAFGKRILRIVVVVFARLANTRVRSLIKETLSPLPHNGESLPSLMGGAGGGSYLYFLCLRKAKCQHIALHEQLHRITHRCIFRQRHLGTRQNAHIQKMLAQTALASYFHHHGALANA